MILTIHDNNLQKVAFIDNNKQGTLNFYNDKWTRYLSKASSLFEFTVFKKTIQTDVVPYQTANALNDQSFVSFVYKGRTYLFNVMTIEETEHTITCTCKDLNLELTNEYTNPFKSDKARTFKEYCDVMGLLEFAALRIGVNEISDQRRTLEWTGQDTKLNRILSLANKFDAEVDFEVRLNSNGTIKDFILNVYHEHDDKHQGVGKVRSDIILKKGKNIRSIKRKIDKTDLIVNAVRPTAQGENGQEITIAGLGPWEVKNENGVVEFFQQGEMLYAPISMQKYPSVWTGSTGNRDKYTRKDITVDTKSKEMLRTQAYKELMRSAYPSVTYEIDGYVDLEIGDTAKVYNGDFYPALLLEVRVSEQTISFTKPSTNKTVFDNVRALKNKLSNGIQERWQELFEASQPYLIKLSTDNGVIFKNQIGQSIVTPTLYKGGKPVVAGVTWRWSLDGHTTTGMTYTVRGADVMDTSTLTVAAYIGNDEVAVDELTFVNVLDGRDGGVGPKGDPGNDGVAGRDGNKVYTSIYEMSANQSGIYLSDLTPTANPANLPPIGSIVIAPSGKMYPIIALNPTSTPPSYTAGALVGNIKGPQGDNGQTPVVHWAYSDNADGTGLTTSDNGQRYIGHYSDYDQVDSMDKTKYRWADRWAKIEVGGRNILRNATFSNATDRTERFTVEGITYINKDIPYWSNLYNGGIENPTTSYHATYRESFSGVGPVIEFNESNGARNWKALHTHLQKKYIKTGNYTFSTDIYSTGTGTKIEIGFHYYNKSGILNFHSNLTTININTVNKWHRVSGQIKLNDDVDLQKDIILYIYAYNFTTNSILYLTRPQLEEGTVATAFGEAQADVEKRIDAKADQAFTQEQLNLLNERAGIIQAELEAKASLDTVNNILKQIKDMKVADEATWAKVEKDLITHLQRVIKIETNLGDQAQRWNAVDTFMQVSNDGLSLGKADGSSSMLFSPDGRITMFSSGTPVMYVDKGVIHIDNGIFSKTVQIGRFREEQYHNNPDINVKRYVG
ncbi:hypothetical protein [Streptococcus sp. 2021WUSS124]|uniref:hypothetical protein n=1 Tax=unclassified Streptococcus TaxID=2608887 RepID=UPI0037919A2C